MSSVEYPISLLSSLCAASGGGWKGGQIVIPLTEPFFSAYPCFICVLKIKVWPKFQKKNGNHYANLVSSKPTHLMLKMTPVVILPQKPRRLNHSTRLTPPTPCGRGNVREVFNELLFLHSNLRVINSLVRVRRAAVFCSYQRLSWDALACPAWKTERCLSEPLHSEAPSGISSNSYSDFLSVVDFPVWHRVAGVDFVSVSFLVFSRWSSSV